MIYRDISQLLRNYFFKFKVGINVFAAMIWLIVVELCTLESLVRYINVAALLQRHAAPNDLSKESVVYLLQEFYAENLITFYTFPWLL